MRKMKNPWKQKLPESVRIRRIPRAERDTRTCRFRTCCLHEFGWCAACVEGRGVGGQHRIELLEEEERERTNPIVAFDYGFLTQQNADTFPILISRDSRYGQAGATCCERKGPAAYSISFLVGFIKDLGFRGVIFEMRQRTEYESTSRCRGSSMCGSGSD